MTKRESNIDTALETTDAAKRETLRKLVISSAFVVPVVTTFGLEGLTTAANALPTNSTHS